CVLFTSLVVTTTDGTYAYIKTPDKPDTPLTPQHDPHPELLTPPPPSTAPPPRQVGSPPPTTTRPAPWSATPTRRPGHQTLSSTRYPPDHESAPWCPDGVRRARPQARRRAKHPRRVGEFLWFRPRLPATA